MGFWTIENVAESDLGMYLYFYLFFVVCVFVGMGPLAYQHILFGFKTEWRPSMLETMPLSPSGALWLVRALASPARECAGIVFALLRDIMHMPFLTGVAGKSIM